MTFSLDNAVVYDVETLPNVFTLHAEMLNSDVSATWEISQFRDDRAGLIQWFDWLSREQVPMIGFNTINFDYPIVHFIYTHPGCTVEDIYNKSQAIITGQDKFGHMIWERDRFAPQIDLFKIHHFDNKAKTTSLKALQVNMRSQSVVDSPVEFGTFLTLDQVKRDLIPYNIHDVKETKRFAKYSMDAINFRIGLIADFGIDVLNYNDTKIGERMLINRIGQDICYERDANNRRRARQTVRHRIALNDIIFPYVSFTNPEFNRVLDYLRQQVLLPADIELIGNEAPSIVTKGVFSGLKAHVGGVDFKFGTGGIHASVEAQRIIADEQWLIRDIDVASLYPNLGIKNRLAPAHLGEAFTNEYEKLPIERKQWQEKKGKKCIEANALKLASNGTYGKTNDKFSPFFDPQYTMTITINGQLLLCMLAEWLLAVPTLQIIQANTDGITYRIRADYEPQAAEVCKRWEKFTLLTLEDASYSRMWIRDVNNYVAESLDGKLKLKGAYEYPDPLNYAGSISTMQPPGWHKDWSNIVSTRAAVAAMIYGIDAEVFIRAHTDPFDFMCRARATGGSLLRLGGNPVQKTTRYYVARDGAPLVKISPAAGTPGAFKRKNGISDAEYNRIAATLPPGEWSELIHTKNRSRYEERETAVQAGWKVALCNDASAFRFDNVDYSFYVQEARKLII